MCKTDRVRFGLLTQAGVDVGVTDLLALIPDENDA